MGYLLHVKEGNLLDVTDMTFVVNASNTSLILGSGVSMAFKQHCGTILQELMRERLSDMSEEGIRVRPADVILTPPGEADNFRFILHAAIMDYRPGAHPAPTLSLIHETLKNIEGYLEWYAQYSETMRLALPLLGCGVGGLEKREVIELYKTFFSHQVDFDCDIFVYGHTHGDAELIREVFSSTFVYSTL